MTPQEIDLIIAARDRLTNRRDEEVDWEAVDAFDAALADGVPPGQDNRVDLMLGRSCAALPPRVDYLTEIADQHEDMLDWKWSQGDLAL